MSMLKISKAALYLEAVNNAMMLDIENRRLKERIKELEGSLMRILEQVNRQLAEPTVNDTGVLVGIATYLEALIPDAGKMVEEKPE